jgi:hypothetical protein
VRISGAKTLVIMNARLVIGVVLLLSLLLNVQGQGTVSFSYDQQSATESTGGGAALIINANQPLGQSFTPLLSQVGFVRLALVDGSVNGVGFTLSLDFLSGSITGPILGSSTPVTQTDGFIGYVDFFFSTPINVTPGTPYYFRPLLMSGDSGTTLRVYNAYGYAGGTAYINGVASSGNDLWFREGVVVPEPSSGAILLLGLCAFAARKRWSS